MAAYPTDEFPEGWFSAKAILRTLYNGIKTAGRKMKFASRRFLFALRFFCGRFALIKKEPRVRPRFFMVEIVGVEPATS